MQVAILLEAGVILQAREENYINSVAVQVIRSRKVLLASRGLNP
jgi:hypothetical protein